MSRHAVIFEDAGWPRLYPLALARPSFDCRVGVTTLGRRLSAQLGKHDVKRVDYLCRHVLRPIVEREYSGHAVNRPGPGDVTFLNGRLLALGEGLDAVLGLLDRAVAVQAHGELAGVRVTGDRAQEFGEELLEALERGDPAPFPKDHTTAPLPENVRLVLRPWDLVGINARVLEDDTGWSDHPQLHVPPEISPGAQLLHRDRIRSREGVKIEAGAILDASSGPIFLGEGVHVQHNAVVLGPAALGPRSVIRVGARLEGGVSLGPACKVGGEVETSIFQSFSNKQHDGYLGHAYVGSWCNLGALTTNSDLKNNYSTVRVWTPEGEVDTGERFVGVFLGDHTKTAIGTMLNTGTVVGFCANVVSAGFPPKHIPSFSWGGAQGFAPYDLEKALEVARVVMQRRQVSLEPADEVLFRALCEQVRGDARRFD